MVESHVKVSYITRPSSTHRWLGMNYQPRRVDIKLTVGYKIKNFVELFHRAFLTLSFAAIVNPIWTGMDYDYYSCKNFRPCLHFLVIL